MKPSKEPTYRSWYSMWDRVSNPNNVAYDRYKDLPVQPEWRSFEEFVKDVGIRPDGTTLDRYPKPELGYMRGNVRWATPLEQIQNRGLFKNNKLGIKGVVCRKKKYYEAYCNDGRHHVSLGSTTDFFEACCLRKSWEAAYGKGA